MEVRGRLGATLVVILAGWSWAPAAAHADPPEIHASPRGETPLVIDGRLDEEAWQGAEEAGHFVERSPHPGRTPPVDTTFRVLFDADALYLGIVMHFPAGETPRGQEQTRDSPNIWSDDAISIKIDARQDRRTTLGFVVNAAGAQLDYVALDNGVVVRRELDATWESAVHVEETRWVVEVRLPVFALGISAAPGERLIGLQLSRDYNAGAATYDWAPMRPEFGAFSALHYGVVRGVVDLGGGTPLAVTPYGLVEYGSRDDLGHNHVFRLSAGLDAQLRLGEDIWVEGTVLTDFAQVDLDDALVNLDRFPLFFPERRPFFLTGLDVFDFGVSTLVQPFYSRRIGLDARGRRVGVLGGVKLYGRAGDFSFGVLDVLTEETASQPSENHLAARLRWAPERGASYLGAIVVSEQPFSLSRPLAAGEGNHVAVGADGLARFADDRMEVSGFVVGTSRDGPRAEDGDEGEGIAASAALRYLGEWAQPSFRAVWVDEGFAPDMGFVRRRGASRFRIDAPFVARPSGFGLRRIQLTLTGELQTTSSFDQQLFLLGGYEALIEADGGWFAGVSGSYIEDTVQRDFEVRPGALVEAGTYRGAYMEAWVNSPEVRNPVVTLFYSINNAYFGGVLHNPYASVAVAIDRWVRISASADVYYAELPGLAGFWTYGINGLLRITPTTTLQLDLIARVNEQANTAVAMARGRWRFAPGSDLWVVYREDVDLLQARSERTITVKLSYRFDFAL